MLLDYIVPGVMIAVAGVMFADSVVTLVSGPDRQAQRDGFREIVKGQHGAQPRKQLFAGLAVAVIGLAGVGVGVDIHHENRVSLCSDFCTSHGNTAGVIDEPAPPALPTCRCEGASPADVAMSVLEAETHKRRHSTR